MNLCVVRTELSCDLPHQHWDVIPCQRSWRLSSVIAVVADAARSGAATASCTITACPSSTVTCRSVAILVVPCFGTATWSVACLFRPGNIVRPSIVTCRIAIRCRTIMGVEFTIRHSTLPLVACKTWHGWKAQIIKQELNETRIQLSTLRHLISAPSIKRMRNNRYPTFVHYSIYYHASLDLALLPLHRQFATTSPLPSKVCVVYS